MGLATAMFLALLSVGFVATGCVLSWRITPEPQRQDRMRWLRSWFLKGAALPLALWLVMNVGISWNLQPFMPQVQAAKNRGGPWGFAYLRVSAAGLFIITSYWSAVTLAWLLARARATLEGDLLSDFKALCWTAFLGMLLPAIGVTWLGGWSTLGMAALAILVPIAGYCPAGLQVTKMPPMYSRAVARIKFGKYSEAEWEIIRELEKREDDFEGWMMLADLYANHFHDLREAEQTVLEICDQPRTTPSQLSLALHRLADWHLKLGEDPEAARRCLQMISDRLPRTHLGHMAALRMQQLPRTTAELREQKTARPIPLPALGDSLDEELHPVGSEQDHHAAAQAANACVRRLEGDPNDVPSREKLARLFAEHLEKVDLGLEQIALLLDMPDQPDSKRAEWLGLTAAWHIKYRQDIEAGRKALERLIRDFPETPQAFAARRRIRLLDVEFRG
jgi:hypothetical protein